MTRSTPGTNNDASQRVPMTRLRPLDRSFFRPSARDVAKELLGRLLVRNTNNGLSGGLIVETEAYLIGDPACHGFIGPTNRNRVMYGEPGHAYVYFIYGCHFCVNAVCQPAGIAEAVLIRALEPVLGQNLMLGRRPVANLRDLTNGPGKICQALEIDRKLNGSDLCNKDSPLFIAENPKLSQFLNRFGPRV